MNARGSSSLSWRGAIPIATWRSTRASWDEIAARVVARSLCSSSGSVRLIDGEAELDRCSAQPAGQLNGPALRLGDGLDDGET
jgi:hypothetical protein